MDLRVFYGPKKYKVRLPSEYQSKDSELSDSDGDDPENIPPSKKRTVLHPEVYDSEIPVGTSNTFAMEEEPTSSSEESFFATSSLPRRPIWKTVNPNDTMTQIKVPVWSGALPASTDMKSPFGYFKYFFEEDILDFIVEQSNIYAVQQYLNRPLRLDRNELEQSFGCCILISLYNLPPSRMYWAARTRISQVADIMTHDRWETIKKNLHLNNNEDIPSMYDTVNHDRLFKIRTHSILLHKYQQLPQ